MQNIKEHIFSNLLSNPACEQILSTTCTCKCRELISSSQFDSILHFELNSVIAIVFEARNRLFIRKKSTHSTVLDRLVNEAILHL